MCFASIRSRRWTLALGRRKSIGRHRAAVTTKTRFNEVAYEIPESTKRAERRLRLFLWLGFVTMMTALLTVVRPEPLAAQVPADTLPGHDIVLLIDQSGSMSGALRGSMAHPTPNDRYGLRISVAHLLVKKLEQAAKKSYLNGKPQSYRYSIVEFGDTARVGVDWHRITYPFVAGAAGSGLAGLDTDNMGGTDFLRGFQLITSQFDKIGFGAGGTSKRALWIFLVTDGQPYTEDPGYFWGGQFHMNQFWDALRIQINDKLRDRASSNGVNFKLGVIAIDDRNEYWHGMEPMWSPLSYKALRVENHLYLQQFLEEHFFNELVEPPSRIISNEFDVPCFVRKAEVKVFPKPPAAVPDLVKPNGSTLLIPGEGTRTKGRQGSYYIIQVPDPAPGKWRITGNKGIVASLDFFPDEARLLSPKAGVPVPQMLPMDIQWRLADPVSGKTFDYSTCGPFRAVCAVTHPDGSVDSLTLTLKGNGTFADDAKQFKPTPGKYQLKLFGDVLMNGRWHRIVDSADFPVTCSSQSPVIGRVLEPSSIGLRFGAGTVRVMVKLESAVDSTAVRVSDVERGLQPFLHAQVFSPKGDTLSPSIPLELDPSGGDSDLVAEIPLKRRFMPFRSLLGSYDYTIHFIVRPEFISDEYFIYAVRR
jgi:hypothetical protein